MDTLILSTSFEPMGRVSWKRAMTLWCAGKVEIIEEYKDRFIGLAKGASIAVPAIIRYITNVRKRYMVRVPCSKKNIYRRDKGECQYCGVSVTRSGATIDHVLPRSRGGGSNWKNLVLSCHSCNQKKGDRLPEEANMKLRKKPYDPEKLSVVYQIDSDNLHPSWSDYIYGA